MFCSRCGTKNPDQACYCISCGKGLEEPPVQHGTAIQRSKGAILDGRYEIVSHISTGGFGRVYRALYSRFNAQVAVKEMVKEAFPPEELKVVQKYFQQEAQVLFSLKHRALPRVIDCFFESESFYLVMEFVEGESLRALMGREGKRLDQERAWHWLFELLDIMEYLHSRTPPIIHRDIKPDNLIWQESTGLLYLVEFGIVRVGCSTKTLSYGTPGYAAPEQASGKAHPSVDIYGTGATLHHLLTMVDPAAQPFDFEPLGRLRPDLPHVFAEIIDRMVALKMRDRFQNAGEIRAFYKSRGGGDGAPLSAARPIPAGGMPAGPPAVQPAAPPEASAAALPSGSAGASQRQQPELLQGLVPAAPDFSPPSMEVPGTCVSPVSSPFPAPAWPTAPGSPSRQDERIIFAGISEEGFEIYQNLRDRAVMIWIPAGEFIMGALEDDEDARKEEKPSRQVDLEGFWLYRHPVTNRQFAFFLKSSGHGLESQDWEEYWELSGDDYPAAWMSWRDARAYCHWAGGDLPTEAQWEKAARGEDGRRYPWGNFLDNSRFNCWDSPPLPCKAAFFENKGPSITGAIRGGASPYGCEDMAGNVWEWCRDSYSEGFYRGAPCREPFYEQERSPWKVLRGGSWNEIPRECRVTRRVRADASTIARDRGFRCMVR